MNKRLCELDLNLLLPVIAALVLLAGCAPAVTPTPTTAPPTAAPSATPLPPTATAAREPITQIYAFGASYTDNGNGARLLGSDWNANSYWEGRVSNGPTGVEVLAAGLNVPLTDYAVLGARSDTESLAGDGPLAHTGMLSQLIQFTQALKGASADPNALFFIMVGGTDFLGNDRIDVETLTDQITENLVTLVTRLSDSGARRFLVTPTSNMADLPAIITQGRSAEASQFQDAMNTKVSARLTALSKQLSLDIKLFDYVALHAKIRAHPSDYGLTNLTDPCQPTDPPGLPACPTPDQYYYWDELHPTRQVHQIFGEAWAALFRP
jgi:phospholipase/lecithinase/hemolysin